MTDAGPSTHFTPAHFTRRAGLARASEAAVTLAARGFFRLWCPLSVEGAHNLPEGPVLICANHRSHLDGAAIGLASGQHPASVAIFVAADYFCTPTNMLRKMPLPCRLIPVDRTNAQRGIDDLHEGCRTALRDGFQTFVVFPEGTRAADHRPRSFRRGAALLSAKLGLPLAPTRIDGTAQSLPRGRRFPLPKAVRVRFGEAIVPPSPGEAEAGGVREWARWATDRLETEICAMGRPPVDHD